ncbi:hydroxylysine kinase isoform X2 [Stigmatopora argus]
MAANHTIPKLSQSQAAEIVQKHYKLTPSSLRFLPSYEDQNICITTVEGDKYVLKIMNTLSSKDPTLIKVQTCAMDFLHQGGLPTPTALKTITGEDMFLEDIDCGYGLQKYLVRLLTYLTGVPISEVPLSPQLLYQVGQIAARMDNLLKEMKHPQLSVLHRGEFVWSLSNIPLLEKWLYVLDGDPLQEIVKSVLHQFKTTVAPKYSSFRECSLSKLPDSRSKWDQKSHSLGMLVFRAAPPTSTPGCEPIKLITKLEGESQEKGWDFWHLGEFSLREKTSARLSECIFVCVWEGRVNMLEIYIAEQLNLHRE